MNDENEDENNKDLIGIILTSKVLFEYKVLAEEKI